MSWSPTFAAGTLRAAVEKHASSITTMDARVFNTILVATQAVAFWPVWEWYAARMIQFPENRIGLLALLTAIFCIAVAPKQNMRRAGMLIPGACIALHVLLLPFVHPLVGCMLAAVVIGYTCAHLLPGNDRAPFIGLLLLALPVIPSMQTYIGYPLRALVAEFAAPWVRMTGFVDATREGVGIRWHGGLVLVDEPCSGIRMLWTGFYLAFTMASLLHLNTLRCIMLCGATLGMVVFGNLMRAVALFNVEARAGSIDDLLHAIVGLFCFALAGFGVVICAGYLSQRSLRAS